MWGAIKKALNSTLGTDKFQPLDELSKKNAYRRFYEKMKGQQYQSTSAFDRNFIIIDETNNSREVTQLPSGISSGRTFAIILPPNTKKLTNYNVAGYVYFYPEGFERLETHIIDTGINKRLFEFPSTTQFIKENAFASLNQGDRVIIHRKQGEIEGHPWGASYDNIRYLDR